MRSSKNEKYNMDQSRYDYHNNEIYVLFVNSCRKMNNPKWSEDCNPTPKMDIVGWCNGDIGQVNNLLTEKVHKNDKLNRIL